jgi:hypothetical protein
MMDQSYEDAITSLAALSRIYGKLARQRDEAQATLNRVAALCSDAEERHSWVPIPTLRAALEPVV